MKHFISFDNVQLAFGGHQVLNSASLSLHKHQCVLLTGRNGAGKSTLLKIMAGLLRPDQASVHYQGQACSWQAAKRYLLQDVIYLHQHPYLFKGTVMDNIAYGLKRRGMARGTIRHKVLDALNWAELDHLALRQATTLSGGEKQRVALTRARILSPRLLLLDEPTSSMDRESKQQTSFMLRRLKTEGITTVISSHEAHTIQTIADRHLLLQNGEIIEQTMQARSSSKEIQNPLDAQS